MHGGMDMAEDERMGLTYARAEAGALTQGS